ncbi:MAG: hypothetical protein FD143_420 [Ignavibacteria bacterium]|nr:MAG: hypothetical protein FD143_420 [Ignavibacteria bacterium]KAF0160354.1 MAG: hypothetical protein FD188_1856 [Ignavibacteria bacterium]
MKQILHIMKYKIKSYVRFDSEISSVRLIKSIASCIIYASFAIGAFFFSKTLINFLLIEITVGQFLLHEFISMILFIFFMSINIGNIIVSYSTLYKSNEVNYLLSKPIEPAKIFTIKFLDNFFYSSSTLLLILFALLIGYSVYFNMPIIKFAVLVLNFIPFMISAGSLGVILLIAVILLANRFGVKRIIYTFGAIYAVIIILFFRINSPRNLVMSVLRNYPILDKDIYLGELVSPILKVLPNNWLSQTAYWILHGDYTKVILYTSLQIGLAVLLFTSAYQLGKKYYLRTWLLNHKLTGEFNSKKQKMQDYFPLNCGTTNQFKTILRKDYFAFVREPSQVIHSLVLFFLLTVFIVSVSGIKYAGLGNFYLQTIIYLSIFIFNILLITTLSLRFIFPLLSLEGLSFWKLKSAPISILKYVLSKLYIPFLIVFFTSITLSLFSNYKFSSILISFSLIVSIIATITIVAINFGMGGLFANYKEKNPIRVSSSQGASISFLISILYMLFLVVLLFKPFSDLFLSIMIKRNFDLLRLFYFTLPMLFVSALIIGVFYKAAATSLKRDF